METENYWKKRANSFSRFYEVRGLGLLKRMIVSNFLDQRTERVMELVDCKRGDRILDAGCGSGVHMSLLLQKCRQVVGIDISPSMIRSAQEHLRQSGLVNWKIQVGDVRKIPFKNGEFSWVLALGLLDYVDSVGDVLKEIHRVLSLSGQAVLTVPKKPSLFGILRLSTGNLVKDKLFGLPPVKNVMNEKDLRSTLGRVGFRILAIESLWTTMWIVKVKKRAIK